MIKFRTAYVACATGHDFDELKLFCEHIHFVVPGEYTLQELPKLVEEGLRDFDQSRDILVPVGRVAVNLIIGQLLGHWNCPYKIALFQDHTYVVYPIQSLREVAKAA